MELSYPDEPVSWFNTNVSKHFRLQSQLFQISQEMFKNPNPHASPIWRTRPRNQIFQIPKKQKKWEKLIPHLIGNWGIQIHREEIVIEIIKSETVLCEFGDHVMPPLQHVLNNPLSIGQWRRLISLKLNQKRPQLLGGHMDGSTAGVFDKRLLHVRRWLFFGHLKPSNETETNPVISHR